MVFHLIEFKISRMRILFQVFHLETDMLLYHTEPGHGEKEIDIPLKRLGTVEEVAATAVLNASDDGNFYCGQCLSPNGEAVFI